MHMRTTLNIDDRLFKRTAELIGIRDKMQLVRLELAALVSREAAKRLTRLGGSRTRLRN